MALHLMVVAEIALDGAGEVVRQEGGMGERELGQVVGYRWR